MTETAATNTLVEAWADRHDRALRSLQQAVENPAFVKPEVALEAEADAAKAAAQYRYWLREDMGR